MNRKLTILIVVVLAAVVMGAGTIHHTSLLGRIIYENPTTVEESNEIIKHLEATIKDLKEQSEALLCEEDKKTFISVWALLKARQEIYNGPYRRRLEREGGMIILISNSDSVCVQNLLKIINKAQELEETGETVEIGLLSWPGE